MDTEAQKLLLRLLGAKKRPEAHHIYFLIKDGEVRYVGQSGNLGARISSHETSTLVGKDFDSVFHIEVEKEAANELEKALVRIMGPPDNKRPSTQIIPTFADWDALRRFVGAVRKEEACAPRQTGGEG